MSSYRDQLKELKQPDDFQKLGVQAVPWLEQHGKAVVTGTVVVLVVWGGIALAQHLSAKGNEASSYEFSTALKVLSRPVSTVPVAEPPKDGEEAPYKSEQERDEALIKSLSAFRLQHSGHTAANNAALPLAQALLRQGKPADALALVDEYLKNTDASDPMRPEAYESRGYALEMQNKYDEALAAFDQLSKETKTDFLKGMGLYHRARLLALKGDKDGAAKQFSEIEAAAPNTAAARLAKERMALLAAQGVNVPKPAPAPAAMAPMALPTTPTANP